MKIILYSTNCPKCKILKKLLSEKQIQFTECNDINKMLELNIDEVPILSVNNILYNYKDAINKIKVM